jgi:hypothetical protein
MQGSTIQRASKMFGVVFLLVGITGLIPWHDGYYDALFEFGGPGAEQLNFIGVNILEVVAHLLYGVAGFVMAKTAANARAYFLGGGALYMVLWIYGLLTWDSNANIIGVNQAANWVHFALGVVMLGIGLVLGREAESPAAA